MADKELTERVFVAIDIQNLWHGGQAQYGPWVRVNYGKLKDLIFSRPIGSYPRNVRLIAYTVTAATKKSDEGSVNLRVGRNSKFLESLQRAGYEIKNRFMILEKGPYKPYGSDWDVGITIDALNNVDSYDTFCLVSGDGDYAMLLESLKEKGKYVEVVTFESTTARILVDAAHRVTYISENEIFRQDPPNLAESHGKPTPQ